MLVFSCCIHAGIYRLIILEKSFVISLKFLRLCFQHLYGQHVFSIRLFMMNAWGLLDTNVNRRLFHWRFDRFNLQATPLSQPISSKYSLRQNGVHFFNISTSKNGSNMWYVTHFDLERHKGAPTALACLRFGCPEPPFIGKTQCVATFYLFAHMDILSSGFLFFDILSSSLLFASLPLPTYAFHLSSLSEV